ncbi:GLYCOSYLTRANSFERASE [Salix purpurea]|nr:GLYCOSYLTRANSFERASE [Salix purpurea]
MFCTTMIDVANEFGVPSYVFFASSAAALSLMLYMQALNDEKNVDTTEFKDSDAEFMLPGIINPVPAKVLPSVVFNKDWHPFYFGNARRFKEAEGIMVNTYVELESQVINAFSNGKTPPLYPIGPILNLKGDGHDVGSAETNKNKDIMEWLDDQPPSSVVFLCFGSMGSFGEEQLKEIARALEQSEYRFLWSVRQPPPKGKMGFPTDYANPEEAVPTGFLDRTAETGKVMFSEQQLNAFEMMVELGLAEEIKMDYRKDFRAENDVIVSADIIEKGIRSVMDQDSEVRKKVKAMSEMSKKALLDGGSSHSFIGRLIEDMMNNME